MKPGYAGILLSCMSRTSILSSEVRFQIFPDNHSRGRSADRNHSGASHQRKIESSTLDSKDKAKARQVSRVADFSPESDYYVQGRTGDIKVLSAKKTVSKAMRADASSPVSSPGTGVRVDASSPVSCNGAEPSSSKGKATIITLQKDGKREVVSGSKTAEVSVATSEAYGQPQPPADDVSSKRSGKFVRQVVTCELVSKIGTKGFFVFAFDPGLRYICRKHGYACFASDHETKHQVSNVW